MSEEAAAAIETAMEWRASLIHMLAGGTTKTSSEGKKDTFDLVVDNAKSHRNIHLHGSGSTMTETRQSGDDSENLSDLLEDLELQDLPGTSFPPDSLKSQWHNSFPFRSKKRRRIPRWKRTTSADGEGSPAEASLKETWSSSDSVLDYSSFDGMLREGSSQTPSALSNVRQPGRRFSLEASTIEFLQQDVHEEFVVEAEEEASEEPDDEDLDQKMAAC
jgi:hypothetical protein